MMLSPYLKTSPPGTIHPCSKLLFKWHVISGMHAVRTISVKGKNVEIESGKVRWEKTETQSDSLLHLGGGEEK